MFRRREHYELRSPKLGHVVGRTLVVAMTVFASSCASQRDTGTALTVVGTAAVLAGAIVASNGSCRGGAVPDEHYAGPYAVEGGCRPNRSRQYAGAAVAAAGLGTAALGNAIESDAKRLDAWNRSRSSSSAPPPSAQSGVPYNSLLALPEAPFTPREPAEPASTEQRQEGSGASDEAEGFTESGPAAPASQEESVE